MSRGIRAKIIFITLALIIAVGVTFIFVRSIIKRPAKIEVVRLENGDFQLLVGGRSYFVRGVCYNPIPPGEGYDFNFWGDPNEPWKVDGELMKKMGVNTVRFYQPGKNPEEVKKVIDDLFRLFGIRSALGHYLGFWDWPPPNYADPEFREEIKSEVLEMVRTYRDEPGILFWVLGNENNYSFDLGINPWSSEELEKIEDPHQKRIAQARIYYTFVNDLARAIKAIDSSRPVVMGNGELASIKVAKGVSPDVDILGGIVYQGKGFGSFWRKLERDFGKPAVMLEFGCDSFNAATKEEDQDLQALYLAYQWKAIEKNAPGAGGVGNCLGGFVFEWNDEWWKHYEGDPKGWSVHDPEGSWSNTSYYDGTVQNNMNEEWLGIVALSPDEVDGVNKRVPKKAYYVLKELWE